MKYQIARATEVDLPLMQRLFYQTVTAYGSKIFSKSEIKMYSRLATDKKYWVQKFLNDFIYNAKLNGEIIGSFSLSNDGNIEYIFVHENYQGKGVAVSLYNTIEKIAKEANIKTLTTLINPLTKSFFEKNGFDIIKKTEKVASGEEVISFIAIKKI